MQSVSARSTHWTTRHELPERIRGMHPTVNLVDIKVFGDGGVTDLSSRSSSRSLSSVGSMTVIATSRSRAPVDVSMR